MDVLCIMKLENWNKDWKYKANASENRDRNKEIRNILWGKKEQRRKNIKALTTTFYFAKYSSNR